MKDLNEIEYAIRNYHWMIKEIDRLQRELEQINIKITSTYGDGHPARSSSKKDSTLSEVIHRERKYKTLKSFEQKVTFVENHVDVITDDREVTVLNCLMDGMNVIQISEHMGFGRRTVYRIKDGIIRKIKNHARKK